MLAAEKVFLKRASLRLEGRFQALCREPPRSPSISGSEVTPLRIRTVAVEYPRRPGPGYENASTRPRSWPGVLLTAAGQKAFFLLLIRRHSTRGWDVSADCEDKGYPQEDQRWLAGPVDGWHRTRQVLWPATVKECRTKRTSRRHQVSVLLQGASSYIPLGRHGRGGGWGGGWGSGRDRRKKSSRSRTNWNNLAGRLGTKVSTPFVPYSGKRIFLLSADKQYCPL
jgi:hypothetical protein